MSESEALISGAGKHIYRSLEDQTPIICYMRTHQLTVTRLELDLLDALDCIKARLRRKGRRTMARAEIMRAILRGVVFAKANISACGSAGELEAEVRNRVEGNQRIRKSKDGARYND